MRACLGGVGVLLAFLARGCPCYTLFRCTHFTFLFEHKNFNKAGISALLITEVQNMLEVPHDVCSRLDWLGG